MWIVEDRASDTPLEIGRRYSVAVARLDGSTEEKIYRVKRGDDGGLWFGSTSNTSPPISVFGGPHAAHVPLHAMPVLRAKVRGIVVGRFVFEE